MQDINLYDLIKFSVKKWRIITIITIAGVLGGIAYNFLQTPLYKSSSKLILVSQQTTQPIYDQTVLNNYIDLIKSHRVLEPVIKDQHIKMTYDQLTKSVEATNEKSTEVINIVVTTNNPNQSTAIANDITNSFKTALSELYNKDNVVVVDTAIDSTQPFNVHESTQLIIAAALGLAIGLVVVYFMYDFNKSLPKNKKHTNTKVKIAQAVSKPKSSTIKEKKTVAKIAKRPVGRTTVKSNKNVMKS